GAEMTVEAVVGDVHLPVVEPLVERRLAVVERAGERLVPGQVLARQASPEREMVALGLGPQGLVLRRPGNVRLRAECLAGREFPAFLKHRIDLARHVFLLSWLACSPAAPRN